MFEQIRESGLLHSEAGRGPGATAPPHPPPYLIHYKYYVIGGLHLPLRWFASSAKWSPYPSPTLAAHAVLKSLGPDVTLWLGGVLKRWVGGV